MTHPLVPLACLDILISGLRRDVDVICGLLGDYTSSCGNYLPTFRDNVSVPSSRVEIQEGKILIVSEMNAHLSDVSVHKVHKILLGMAAVIMARVDQLCCMLTNCIILTMVFHTVSVHNIANLGNTVLLFIL
jgi:hypothetical protein